MTRERARANHEARKWYRTARWFGMRRQVLNANPLCVACQAQGFTTLATEIDHIRRHEGDPRRFWDRANLQGLCKTHHSEKTARGE